MIHVCWIVAYIQNSPAVNTWRPIIAVIDSFAEITEQTALRTGHPDKIGRMALVQQPTFNSLEEELIYWKDLAQRALEEKDSIQREYEDYTADSQQLEKEYEFTIEQNERTAKELRSVNNILQNKVENLQMKLEQANRENASMRSDIDVMKEEHLKITKYVRELEQKNDDLERAQRVVTETVGAFEISLNNALERNAILESEVDEKECLKEKLQRLADETRDLKQELQVREREKIPDNERAVNGHAMSIGFDSNRFKIESETQTPLKPDGNVNLKNIDINAINAPLSPASRLLAINIVSDVIRKVGLSRFLCDHCGRFKCTVCSSDTATNNPLVNTDSNVQRAWRPS